MSSFLYYVKKITTLFLLRLQWAKTICAVIFVIYITFPLVAGATIYQPGQTLEPDCAPGSANCGVATTTAATSGGTGISAYQAGDLLYALSSSVLSALNIGASGKVLKVSGGLPTWGDDNGGTAYTASEQGLHLATSTNIFSIALDGSTLSSSASGLKISSGYAGQTSINTLGTITTGHWHGDTIDVSHGGTGLTATPNNGELLIGNGTGFALANLAGSDGVTITNNSGAITIGLAITSAPTITSVSGTDYLPIYTTGSETRKKITYNDLFSGVLGALTYQGTWNANTNSPVLADGDCISGSKGKYYVVSTTGTSTLGGVSSWGAGDWVVCNGIAWERTSNTNTVSSVFSRTGVITAQPGDYTGSQITNVASGTISSITVQSAINELGTEKEPVVASGTISQYWRGDKTWQTLDTAAVSENASALYFTDARARSAFSNSATGLTYSSTTGALSLTSGYSIPLTASTTDWTTAFSRSVSAWTSPLQFSGGTASIIQADTTHSGYLSSTDWNTFNNKVGTGLTINTTAPLSGGGDLSTNRTFSISQSGASSDGYLSSVDWNTFNNKQAALGFTAENSANKSIDVVTDAASDIKYPSVKAVKAYTDSLALGLSWQNPVELINVVGDATSSPVSPVNLDGYIINTGGNSGVWASFAPGDLVQYQTPTWVKIKSMGIGDRFGVGFKSTTTPSGSMTGYKNYKVQITGGSAGAFAYTFTAPANNDALFVQNTNAYYHNVSFTYSSSSAAWIQLSATVDYSFTSGLNVAGKTVSLGALTSDWNQTGAFDITTAGDINLNGGDLKTTTSTATLFNTNATTLNIGGAATTITLGAAGATITGGGALTIDSGTTGALNLGTGNNAKTISIGTGNAGDTINIGTNNTVADAIAIGSALDALSLSSTGLNVTTAGALTGVASIDTIGYSSTTITFAGAGTLSSTGANALALDSGTTGAVNIGTGANAKTITLGNVSGATALNINTGTGGSTYTTTNGAFNLNTGTGAINLGTDAAAKTITIGNGTGATALAFNAGTGGIDIGANAVARTINIGTGAAVAETINVGGTGANVISIGNTQTVGSISLGAAMTGGTISIGGTGLQTGSFDIAPGTGAQTISLANGSGIKTINIGNGISGNTISIGNGANTSAQTLNIAAGAAGANSTVNILSGVATAGTQTLNLGTGASAKAVNIGNTTGATALSLQSGTGSIVLEVSGTGTAGKVQIGTVTGKTTPDLLVLDAGSADPSGVNGGMYYSTATNKFRCYQNGAWANCIGGDKYWIPKSSDQSVTNSTTLTSDTALTFSVGSGETWVFDFNLFVTNGNSAGPDFKAAILGAAGWTCSAQMSGTESAGAAFPQAVTTGCTNTPTAMVNNNINADANQGFTVRVQGTITTNSAGSVTLQFAENTAGAGTSVTVKGGSYVEAFKVGGADLAEVYYGKESFTPGTVISIDPDLPAGVKKSAGINDKNLLGVVTTKPGMVLGSSDNASGVPVLVALSGRVPVNVSAENGPIKIGDYLTGSSISGVAMKAVKDGVSIGQALSGFDGSGTGQVLMFVKNTYFPGEFSIFENQLLLGDISPKVNADGSDNGLSALITTIQAETARDPISIFTAKISDSKQFLADFVAARITAIRGYFDEVFAKKIHTNEVCVKKSDGGEVCLNGDQLNTFFGQSLSPQGQAPAPVIINDEVITNNPEPAPAEENLSPTSTDAGALAVEPGAAETSVPKEVNSPAEESSIPEPVSPPPIESPTESPPVEVQ